MSHEFPRRLPRANRLAIVFLVIVAVGAWLAVLPSQARTQGSTVLVTRVDGTITPVVADHLVDGVAGAERHGYAAFLVELDTPGGLDTSMREIVKAFLDADIPVVVYLTPPGRAASAGALITVASGTTVTLQTAGATAVEQDFGLFPRLLQLLADPNLAFVFLSLGTLAIIYELANPGVGFGGIAGAVFLLLGFFALSVLPINLVGVLLLALAAALLVAELLVPGVGVFAAGGTVALILGGLFLFDGPVAVAMPVLWPVALVVGAGSVLAGRLAWRARRAPSITGVEGLVGRQVTVRTGDGPTGQVLLDGAWWTARSTGAPLAPGQTVRIVDLDGLELIVDPEEEPL